MANMIINKEKNNLIIKSNKENIKGIKHYIYHLRYINILRIYLNILL